MCISYSFLFSHLSYGKMVPLCFCIEMHGRTLFDGCVVIILYLTRCTVLSAVTYPWYRVRQGHQMGARQFMGLSPGQSVKSVHSSRFQCHFCLKMFSSTRDCVGHMNSRHLNRKPYTCEKCSKSFSHKTSLNCHKRSAHP